MTKTLNTKNMKKLLFLLLFIPFIAKGQYYNPNNVKLGGLLYLTNPMYSSISTGLSTSYTFGTSAAQFTNTGKTLFAATINSGFTVTSDTILNTYAGYYSIHYNINVSSASNVEFYYLIKAKTGSTTRTLYTIHASGLGTGSVSRDIHAYNIHLAASDKIWLDAYASSSTAVTISDVQMGINTISLD